MAHEGFNITPGMSTWVDMPEKYKRAYFKKFPPKEETVNEELPEIENEPEIELPLDNIDIPIDMEIKVVENPCPVCGNELPKGKKYCTKECFYNRFK